MEENKFGDKENKNSSSPQTSAKFGDKENKNSSSPQTSGKFGDFEEVVDESEEPTENVEGEEVVTRVRMPREGELIGIIVQRYGGNRMEVRATDGKTRNCRVPGRYRRKLWLRPGDLVIIVPWKDDDNKGDIIFKYRGGQINQLRKKGIVDQLKEDF